MKTLLAVFFMLTRPAFTQDAAIDKVSGRVSLRLAAQSDVVTLEWDIDPRSYAADDRVQEAVIPVL